MRRGLTVLALLAGAAAPTPAQAPALTITLQNDTPRIQTTGLLADGRFDGLMHSGFPLRLHYRLELWRNRANWFDEHISDFSWDGVAHYDPVADDYILIRSGGLVSRYATTKGLEDALAIPYRVTLAPKGPGRFYFLCRLEVSTLNDTDLEELTRWLKGEVGPAVSGRGDVGDALARGLQRVLVRIAGLPRLTLEQRSPQFVRAP